MRCLERSGSGEQGQTVASSVRRGNRELLDRKPQLGRLRVHYYGQESHSGVKALLGWECSAPGGHKTVGSKEVTTRGEVRAGN